MWGFLPLLAWPLIEIGLFVTVGAWLGLWATLAIVVLTAVLGVQILRQQGMGSMQDLQRARQSADPLSPLAHQAIKAIAGLLLILPGFLTDAIGVLLLIPALRNLVIAALASRVQFSTSSDTARQGDRQSDFIDGDYEVLPPEQSGLQDRSKWGRH